MKTSLKVIACMAALAILVGVQSAKAAADQEIKIPNLIKLSGTAKDPNGLPKAGTLQIKFGLYASKEGGDVLWNETQVVTTDAEGNYSVYLGASEEKGLPLELFSAEKARWLGVQVEGEEEQDRVLFVAVPYALKAADAETVGGKPLSSFVLYEDLEKLAEDSTGQGGEATDEDGNPTASNRSAGAINLLKSTSLHGGNRERSMQAVINGSGVANALAKFSDSENITASVLSEVGGNIGVGTLSPYAKLTFSYNSTTTDPIAMMDTAVGGRNWRFGGGVGAPGAFTIRDDTAGANRFSITSNGNIGVGTASPIAKFSFEYDSSAVDPIAMTDTAVGGRSWRLGGGVGAPGTFTIRDDTAGANRLSISSGGNVGIGTTSPSSKLTVDGDIESSTGFRIGGSKAFSIAGTTNTFIGLDSGQANTTGSYNAASGSSALYSNTSGNANTASGYWSLYSNTTGNSNTASGSLALTSNTTGTGNTASGTLALYLNTTGSFNTASGYQALSSNTTGQANTASGTLALYLNTTGNFNTASGYGALLSNTTGSYNTASGYQALQLNTTGSYNAASGFAALRANTTGSQNTAAGSGALLSNTTGSNNTSSGYNALFANTTGQANTASGAAALNANTTGNNNSATGTWALQSNTTGNNSTASGSSALMSNTTGNNNTANGKGALYANTTGNSNTASGYQALYSNTTGNYNTASGYQALYTNTTGYNNTASGTLALYYNTTGSFNTASGHAALFLNTTGNNNTASGYFALASNTTGSYNTASGYQALASNTTGAENMASGYQALYSNTTGFWNTGSGYNALYFNTTGYENTASGRKALYYNTTGYNNTASGVTALFENTTGYNNTASGYGALSENTTGYKNTASGYNALNSNTTGNLNTSLGDHAGYNVTTGSNNIYINNEGDTADSNTIRIGIVTPTTDYPNAHTQTFIAGIANATVSGSTVFIDSNGQLGIATSSRRFKEDIRDMGDASSSLLQLRPVTFHYKPEYSKSAPSLQYGLIAEEVAEVYPDLVQYDKDGKPFTVQYQVLSSMLLNEVRKQHDALEKKDAEINALKSQNLALDARLAAVEGIMNRLSMQTSENREGK